MKFRPSNLFESSASKMAGLNQGRDGGLLLHLPTQRVGIHFENDRLFGAAERDLVGCSYLAAMNFGNGCNPVTRQNTVNNCLRGRYRHPEIGTNAHESATL
jgi:hypothetical protein